MLQIEAASKKEEAILRIFFTPLKIACFFCNTSNKRAK
jgi:hypothetical protein